MECLIIRDAQFFDYKTLCEVFSKSNDFHKNKLRPDYYRKVDPIISKKDFFKAALVQQFEFGRRRVCIKIAEKNGKAVGAIFAISVKRRALGWSKFKKEAVIDNIFVDKDLRRRGIGKSLFKAFEDWAQDTGHEYKHTSVSAPNKGSQKFFDQTSLAVTDIIYGGKGPSIK